MLAKVLVTALLMAGANGMVVSSPAVAIGSSATSAASPVVRLPRAVTVPIDVDGKMCSLEVAEGADPAVAASDFLKSHG